MNKVRSIVLAIALLVAMIAPMGAVLAQDGGQIFFQEAVVTTRSLAVRAEADPTAEVVATVTENDVVGVLEVGDTFSLIVTEEGIEGYALNLFLDIRTVELNLAAVTNTNSELAVYDAPSLSGDVVTTLADDETVGVLFVEGVWARIFGEDFIGWTFEADLVLDADPASFTNFLVDTAEVNVNSALAVYDEPSLSGGNVTILEDGAVVSVLFESEDGLWSYIASEGGNSGWVFSADLVITESRAAGFGVTNADRVLFRSSPEISNETIIRPLNLGDEVLVIDVTEDFRWFEVRIGEETGFVSTQFVDTDAFDLTIAGVAELAGFDTLLAAVAAADPAVAEALTNPDAQLTVFAPTNEAFEALGEETLNAVLADQEQLTSILLFHVVDGEFLAADVIAAAGDDGVLVIASLEGSDLTITIDADGNVFVNDIAVVSFDVQATNGVIHVIEGVLIP